MEQEQNFNWLEIYMDIQEGKDIKNSEAFKILNSNNIDTNELTKHEKDKDAGLIELNYKDEKEKETDSISFAKGLLAFVADMPEETLKSLSLAYLNGVDVAANVVGVVFNAMTNADPAMNAAFQTKNLKEFKRLVNKNIQDFSKTLSEEKEEIRQIGEGSELNSKAAQWVSMITQDTPYSLPIYKKLKSLGMPNWMALPVAYGIGSGVAFDDDATLFLNSEQVQSFKEMTGALPDSSEEKIFNTVYRTFEGTALGFAIPYVFQGLKFAKNTIPKYMTPQTSIATGGAATAGAVVDKANAEENVLSNKPNDNNLYDFSKVTKDMFEVMEGERIESLVEDLKLGLSDKQLYERNLEGEFSFETIKMVKDKLLKSNNVSKNISNQEMQDTITKAEKADDQILFFDGDRESGPDEPINDYITITDPKALQGADIVFYDNETMEQMTYQKINESDDNWIILNKDRETSYNQ